MATDVITGFKTEFWLHDGTALAKIAEILDVPEFPSAEKDLIETSHMDSVDYKEYINAPLAEGNEVTIKMNLIPNSASDLLCIAAADKTAPLDCKIVYLTATGSKRKKTGKCLVRSYKGMNPMDDRRTAELTVKWTAKFVDAVEV